MLLDWLLSLLLGPQRKVSKEEVVQIVSRICDVYCHEAGDPDELVVVDAKLVESVRPFWMVHVGHAIYAGRDYDWVAVEAVTRRPYGRAKADWHSHSTMQTTPA